MAQASSASNASARPTASATKSCRSRTTMKRTSTTAISGLSGASIPRPRTWSIEFDGRAVAYGLGEPDEVTLAYATTIHNSQRSEYPAVVLALNIQQYPMVQRNLLYTAVTRGKR